MAYANLVRLGGLFGLLAVIVIIPGYLVGYPDSPASPELATSYFEAGVSTFLLANGVLPLFHVFFLILFLGVLYGVLRRAQEDTNEGGGGLPAAALAGGIVYAALLAVGAAVEILYPASVQRFGLLEADPAQQQIVLTSLTLSSWLYDFCQVGASALVLTTSLVALGTGVLPRWLVLAGFVVALLTLLHFLLPLLGALAGLAWIAVVSVLMLADAVGSTGGPHIRRVRSS